jgi:hypothetical protein
METRRYFDFKSMTKADDEYYSTATEIVNAYSKMKRPERITFIKENKRVADLVSRDRWDIPSLGILETSLDPRGEHFYREIGILGIKYNTALYAEFIQRKFMPSHMANQMRINIKSKKDLTDIKTSIRIAYTLLWWYDQCYEGSDRWSVSVYHWGGFIAKYWKRNKKPPPTFKINGITYSVDNYYLAWKELTTCFKKGQLEPVANIYARHKKEKTKLHRKEIEYRKMKGIIKGFEKKIAKYKKEHLEREESIEELIEYKKWSKKELAKIGYDARRGKAKGMVLRIRQLAREFLKKLKGK